ncbi:MAG: hypothetical protein AB7Q37_19025, partial [Pyrinomonadaceae bacterium]
PSMRRYLSSRHVMFLLFVVSLSLRAGVTLNHLFGIVQGRRDAFDDDRACRVGVARKKTFKRRPIHPSKVAGGDGP